MSLRRGKARYEMDLESKNRRSADSKVGNVDPCPREGEGAEGSDRHRIWMSLFAQCSASGWLLGFVSLRAKDVHVPDGPMPSLSVTRIISGVVKRCLRHRTYFAILTLRRCFVEKPLMAAEPPVEMV